MLRKTLAKRKLAVNVASAHRTKARHDAPSRPAPLPPVETLVSPSIPSYHCSDKQIALGRKLSFEFLREE